MSRNQRFIMADKLSAVLCVLNEHQSYRVVAHRFGCGEKQVRRWVAFYNRYGAEGLDLSAPEYCMDFKLSVVRFMEENHLSLLEACVHFRIPNDSIISRWRHIYRTQGVNGFTFNKPIKLVQQMNKKKSDKKPQPVDPKQKELEKELEYLRAENAYLKKLHALVLQKRARQQQNESESSGN